MDVARAHVSLLGPVKARVEGQEIGVNGAKPRLLLALLALNAGRAVSVEDLIDRMWGEYPPPTARKALQVHVSTLRRLLGERVISTESAGYRIEADVDAIRFESMIEEANRRLADQPETAITGFDKALSLWRGTPFADLPDEEALVPERVRMTELRLGAIERRSETLIDLGRHHEVLGDLERMTADHPYREELRALQMVALYRSGRQADALNAFQVTRHRLAEDLGIDPSTELQELEQRVLEQDPSLGPSRLTRPSAHPSLSMRGSDLVGRDDDRAGEPPALH